MENPYESTPAPANLQLAMDPDSKPQVCVWYSVYCACFLLLYILVGIGGVILVLFANEIAASGSRPDKDAERMSNIVGGIFLIVLSFFLSIVFAVGLKVPRKKWGWIYGFFPIAIGLTSPCCMLASIPLLIFWLNPKTKRWFNVD
jgi:ABC-type nitrate/sulfonate/bicarbonate transport system permease component